MLLHFRAIIGYCCYSPIFCFSFSFTGASPPTKTKDGLASKETSKLVSLLYSRSFLIIAVSSRHPSPSIITSRHHIIAVSLHHVIL